MIAVYLFYDDSNYTVVRVVEVPDAETAQAFEGWWDAAGWGQLECLIDGRESDDHGGQQSPKPFPDALRTLISRADRLVGYAKELTYSVMEDDDTAKAEARLSALQALAKKHGVIEALEEHTHHCDHIPDECSKPNAAQPVPDTCGNTECEQRTNTYNEWNNRPECLLAPDCSEREEP